MSKIKKVGRIKTAMKTISSGKRSSTRRSTDCKSTATSTKVRIRNASRLSLRFIQHIAFVQFLASVNQWEERRKKAILHRFYKELNKDQQNSAEASLNFSETFKNADKTTRCVKRNRFSSTSCLILIKFVCVNSKSKKSYAFFKAKQEYQRKQEEKKKRREEALRVKAEREEALKKYKEKKLRNFKVLSKKTRKGQPVMKGRIEMLLDKIQQSTAE